MFWNILGGRQKFAKLRNGALHLRSLSPKSHQSNQAVCAGVNFYNTSHEPFSRRQIVIDNNDQIVYFLLETISFVGEIGVNTRCKIVSKILVSPFEWLENDREYYPSKKEGWVQG